MFKHFLFYLSTLPIIFLAPIVSANQGNWVNKNPVPAPSPRYGHAMALNPIAGKVILFGGHDGTQLLNDTWTYDVIQNTWVNIKPANPPTPRYLHSLVYDDTNAGVMLFGGSDGINLLNDAWVLQNNVWTNILPLKAQSFASGKSKTSSVRTSGATDLPPIPPARFLYSFVYDVKNQKLVLFGGYGGSSPLGDTWTRDILDEISPVGSIVINHGAQSTDKKEVVLALEAQDPGGSGVSKMRFANSSESWTGWETFNKTRNWSLSDGLGLKAVFVQFKDAAGNESQINWDAINLSGSVKKLAATKITLKAKPKIATVGQKVLLYGFLTSSGSKALSGNKVIIYYSKGKRLLKAGKAKTNNKGKFNLKVKAKFSTIFVASFIGSKTLSGSLSNKVIVLVKKKKRNS